jgi:hypothetical protein
MRAPLATPPLSELGRPNHLRDGMLRVLAMTEQHEVALDDDERST